MKDIGLPANRAPGMLGTYQLQMNVTYQNLHNSSVLFDLYIVTVSEGCITIEDNRAITQLGVLSQNDVLDSLGAPEVSYNQLMKFSGASFWSNLKNFFGDVARGIKSSYETVAPIVKEAIPIVQGVKTLLGHGRSGGARRIGRPRKIKKSVRIKASKKMRKHRAKRGGILVGGAMIDRSDFGHY